MLRGAARRLISQGRFTSTSPCLSATLLGNDDIGLKEERNTQGFNASWKSRFLFRGAAGSGSGSGSGHPQRTRGGRGAPCPLPSSLVPAPYNEEPDTKCRFPVSGSTPIRAFSSDISAFPPVTDPDVKRALKDILASDWGELEESVKSIVMDALSKETDDKSGKETLANALRAAEAVEHFSGVLESLRMEIDEISGSTGENVRPLPDELQGALQAAYKRYSNYLDAFGPEETYLKKKVENELGTSMIHIKMRCAGLDSEWGKVTLLGTSGISGSYIEQRS